MKIKNIAIKNFKFHHDLKFSLDEKSTLIYGENGTGKSSIYDALYSNFYYFKNKNIVNNTVSIRDKYIHRDYLPETLEVDVVLTDNIHLKRVDDELENSFVLQEPLGENGKLFSGLGIPNIYFANEKVLHSIIDKNFYDVANNVLTEHFSNNFKLQMIYDSIERDIKNLQSSEIVTEELIKRRVQNDQFCKKRIDEIFPVDIINKILKDDFKEQFEVELKFENSKIESASYPYRFVLPEISIAIKDIDDRGDFKNHFNEAKLKLISIAIYFALAKKHETQNSLKLLVLDDFLTSLDMANRKLIVQYIFKEFKEYQKIILTHNIQFFNLFQKLIRLNNESIFWDVKTLFTFESTAYIQDKARSYLEEAKKHLHPQSYNLQIAGNFLRREFEYICHEFEQQLHLGKKEEMQNIINALKQEDKYFFLKPHDEMAGFISHFERTIENVNIDNDKKLEIIQKKIGKCKTNTIQCDDKMYKILDKTEFYKNILLNPTSHNDTETEVYKKECEQTVVLLEKLNKYLN
ncbi:hypothetical protein [Aliarcobacter butzleri]|uniref:hypothetical protein n=1 Tax=Aliarcobacter butzleri TaxID=28197 RepID=UPI002B25569D|nr:hypothetical protein [Aliarcobacter butzleri]